MFKAESWAALFLDYRVFANGLLATIQMTIVSFSIAMILGLIMGLFSTSGKKPLAILARIYVEFIQNTPLMLQALFLFYGVTFSGIRGFAPIVAGMIALGIYHGAYFAEVFRAGIEAIPKGQFEAAYSQGFTYIQAMRHIVFPQTIKIILPPMVNQVVNLIKNTSCMLLVGGAVDLISATNAYAVGQSTARYAAAAYAFSGILFFCICFPLSLLAGRWENRLKKRDQQTNNPILATVVAAPDKVSDAELDEIIKEKFSHSPPSEKTEKASKGGEGK
jgi:putative glutamine transport system permease protein